MISLRSLLFMLETYEALAHAVVFFRIRLLPRKDVKSIRLNALAEAVLVFITNFVVTSSQLRWLSVPNIALHLYCFALWDGSKYAEKLMSFTSLEWNKGENSKNWIFVAFFTVGLDIGNHVIDMYLLGQLISLGEIAVASIFAIIALGLVLFSPMYAWRSATVMPPSVGET